MNIDQNLVMTLGGGFFGGILIGYALKKVIKILSIVVGLFLAGLAYLQYQQIAKINWDKLQSVSQDALTPAFLPRTNKDIYHEFCQDS